MSQDDPFSSANSDRTLIMPAPGRQSPHKAILPSDNTDLGISAGAAISSGVNALVAAAVGCCITTSRSWTGVPDAVNLTDISESMMPPLG